MVGPERDGLWISDAVAMAKGSITRDDRKRGFNSVVVASFATITHYSPYNCYIPSMLAVYKTNRIRRKNVDTWVNGESKPA